METKSFDEAYTMRSTFFRLVGAAAKLNGQAFRQADLDNQANIKEIIYEAMVHYLVEAEGYTREELGA